MSAERRPVERIPGRVMAVNSFLVHGPDGVVVVDGTLAVSDAQRVRAAVDRSGVPLAGVLVTHPHPDHYAGLAHVVGPDDVPIVATRAVADVIRRDDDLKDAVVGPMMGDEWPVEHRFPDYVVDDGDRVRLGGLTFTVEELGPGESHMDTVWWLDPGTAFAGDLPYAGDHDTVLAAMKEVVPTDDLLFLLDLSIDPVHAARHPVNPLSIRGGMTQ